MYKNVKEKMHFMLRLMTVQSRGAPEGTLEGAPNDALSNLHKGAQDGAFEVALTGALEVALGLHLSLYLLMKSLTTNLYKMAHIMVDLMLH